MNSSTYKEAPGTGLKINSDGSSVIRMSNNKEYSISKSSNGYAKTKVLYSEGKRKTWSIHRLVALAFIPNPDNLPVINHKDGNKFNNDVSNLEWCSHRENCLHARKMGLMDKAIYDQTKHLRNEMIKRLSDWGYSQKQIANAFGIGQSNISRILE